MRPHADLHCRRWVAALQYAVFLAMVLAGLYTNSSHLMHTRVHVNFPSDAPPQRRRPIRRLRPDQCNALRRHEDGRWQHHYLFRRGTKDFSAETRNIYTTLERDWLSGKNQSFRPYIVSGSPACKLHADTPGLMYTTRLGHQCGCGVQGFRPSHSVWTHNERDGTANNSISSHSEGNNAFNSPSLRLIDRLARANQTLCFFGDSIDLQFYDALRHNIERISMLMRQNKQMQKSSTDQMHISIESQEVQVNYTDDTGPSWYGKNGFRYMRDISETTIGLQYGGEGFSTSFYWIKSYGWSPGHTSFTDHCTIIIANLGLHYSVRTGRLTQSFTNATLATDFHAAIAYLTDFASSGDKLAIWRSALPQHFDTHDGHHEEGKHCSLTPRESVDGHRVIQKYNRFYEQAFAKICSMQPQALDCSAYEHTCRVNVRSEESPTLYQFYRENSCCRKRLERLEKGDAFVTGSILRWNIADLFDVPRWHVGGNDCSHYCYIPAMYEAAFERLDLLLLYTGHQM